MSNSVAYISVALSSLKKKMSNPLVRTSFFFAAATGIVKLFQFVLFSHLAKVLGAGVFGVFGLLYTYQVTLNTFATVGIIERLPNQFTLLDKNEGKTKLYRKTNSFFLLLTIASFIGIVIYASFDRVALDNVYPFLYFSLSAILLSYFTIQSSFFRFENKFLPSVVISNLPLFISLLAVLFSSLLTQDLHIIALANLAGFAVGFMVLYVLKYYYGFERISKADIILEIKTIWPFLFIAIFSLFSGYGINFMVSKLLSIDDVGVFTFFVTITSLMHLIANSMNLVWAPNFFSAFESPDRIKLLNNNKKFYILQSCILFAASIVVLVLLFLFSNYFSDYKIHFFKLCFLFSAYLLNVAWYMNTNFYLVTGRSKQLLKIVTVSGIIGLIGLYFCIVQYGTYGIYYGFLFSYLVKSVMIGYDANRYWKSKVPWFFIIVFTGLIF